MTLCKIIGTAYLVSAALMLPLTAQAKTSDTGRGSGPVIYVISQGLYFDSIVLTDLPPMKGRFQQLIPGMNGLETEYGPGQPGHLGGRWWLDSNENGMMDAEDAYFMCPLLGPGRDQP